MEVETNTQSIFDSFIGSHYTFSPSSYNSDFILELWYDCPPLYILDSLRTWSSPPRQSIHTLNSRGPKPLFVNVMFTVATERTPKFTCERSSPAHSSTPPIAYTICGIKKCTSLQAIPAASTRLNCFSSDDHTEKDPLT